MPGPPGSHKGTQGNIALIALLVSAGGLAAITAQGILADRCTSFYNPAGEFFFPARIYYFAYVVLTPVGFFRHESGWRRQ